MALSLNWKKHLNSHSIFKELREEQRRGKVIKESENIIAVKDGELFAWSNYHACVYATNLKQLIGKEEDVAKSQFQTLLCNHAPSSHISGLVFNEGGNQLAIWGRKELSVLELPRKWGKNGLYQGGKERIICHTVSVGARYRLSTSDSLLQVAWHPGSSSDLHLVTLMTDSTIRIYNILDPDNPIQSHVIRSGLNISKTQTPSRSISSPLGRKVESALGETAVDFDFGPPISPSSSSDDSPGPSTLSANQDLVWPVYTLMGDGDVYILYTVINSAKKRLSMVQTSLEGPLSMYPPAEDNYGTDSCSLVCLPVSPPVLVIATCEGKLHHCVSLSRGAQEQESLNNSFSPGNALKRLQGQQLFVYETIELELSLAREGGGAGVEEITCPIHLLKDVTCPERYHCYHNAGVHSVALPWQCKFQEFCQSGEDTRLPTVSDHETAIVEHLVCTQPMPTSRPCPMLGLAVVGDPLLGKSLLALNGGLECLVLPLVYQYKASLPFLEQDAPQTPGVQHTEGGNFEDKIRNILRREYSNPIIRTAPDAQITPEQSWQIISRALQGLREEYMLKQELAREEIADRQRVVLALKEQQQHDVEELLGKRTKLTNKARQLSHRYDEIQEKHSEISARLEMVLRQAQARAPRMSNAEVSMRDELVTVKDKLDKLYTNVKQLQQKKEYQDRQMKPQGAGTSRLTGSSPDPRSSSRNPDQQAGFSQAKQTHLISALKEEGTDIAELIKKVKKIQTVVDSVG